MPSGWFKKNRKTKKKAEECTIVEADLQNCALEDLPAELYQHARTLQTVRLNSNSLTSLPTVSPLARARMQYMPQEHGIHAGPSL